MVVLHGGVAVELGQRVLASGHATSRKGRSREHGQLLQASVGHSFPGSLRRRFHSTARAKPTFSPSAEGREGSSGGGGVRTQRPGALTRRRARRRQVRTAAWLLLLMDMVGGRRTHFSEQEKHPRQRCANRRFSLSKQLLA